MQVIAHLDEYNIDPARVAVGGLSAGGHMAAIIAHVCRDEGIPLAFQLLAVPAVDLTAWTPESDKIAPDCPYDSYRDLWDVPELSLERMKFFVNHFLGGPRPPEYDNVSSLIDGGSRYSVQLLGGSLLNRIHCAASAV